jgi:hypothetical protein
MSHASCARSRGVSAEGLNPDPCPARPGAAFSKTGGRALKAFRISTVLARASVEELLPFVSRPKAPRLVSSLRMGAVALREERQSLTIDSPLTIADLVPRCGFSIPNRCESFSWMPSNT